MKNKQIIKLVKKLNEELLIATGDSGSEVEFEFISDGINCVITFNDFVIWSSQEDMRETDQETGEYEDLENFVKNKFNDIVDELVTLKFVK